jgi:hypothetical protein
MTCTARMPWPVACRILAAPILVLLGCGGAPVERAENPDLGEEPDAARVVDWERRVVSLEAPGWTLAFCEGEGPFLCVERDGRHAGSVELLRTAVADHSILTGTLRQGGSEVEALARAAADLVAIVDADRKGSHGADYRLLSEQAPATVMGTSGLRLVMEERLGDRVIGRIVQYYVIQRDTSYLFSATGMEGGGMLGEFSSDELAAFGPLFAEVAAASRVRAGATAWTPVPPLAP